MMKVLSAVSPGDDEDAVCSEPWRSVKMLSAVSPEDDEGLMKDSLPHMILSEIAASPEVQRYDRFRSTFITHFVIDGCYLGHADQKVALPICTKFSMELIHLTPWSSTGMTFRTFRGKNAPIKDRKALTTEAMA
ncbi:hypothetical protein STEG23_002886 [Scotinomys teguina]